MHAMPPVTTVQTHRPATFPTASTNPIGDALYRGDPPIPNNYALDQRFQRMNINGTDCYVCRQPASANPAPGTPPAGTLLVYNGTTRTWAPAPDSTQMGHILPNGIVVDRNGGMLGRMTFDNSQAASLTLGTALNGAGMRGLFVSGRAQFEPYTGVAADGQPTFGSAVTYDPSSQNGMNVAPGGRTLVIAIGGAPAVAHPVQATTNFARVVTGEHQGAQAVTDALVRPADGIPSHYPADQRYQVFNNGTRVGTNGTPEPIARYTVSVYPAGHPQAGTVRVVDLEANRLLSASESPALNYVGADRLVRDSSGRVLGRMLFTDQQASSLELGSATNGRGMTGLFVSSTTLFQPCTGANGSELTFGQPVLYDAPNMLLNGRRAVIAIGDPPGAAPIAVRGTNAPGVITRDRPSQTPNTPPGQLPPGYATPDSSFVAVNAFDQGRQQTNALINAIARRPGGTGTGPNGEPLNGQMNGFAQVFPPNQDGGTPQHVRAFRTNPTNGTLEALQNGTTWVSIAATPGETPTRVGGRSPDLQPHEHLFLTPDLRLVDKNGAVRAVVDPTSVSAAAAQFGPNPQVGNSHTGVFVTEPIRMRMQDGSLITYDPRTLTLQQTENGRTVPTLIQFGAPPSLATASPEISAEQINVLALVAGRGGLHGVQVGQTSEGTESYRGVRTDQRYYVTTDGMVRATITFHPSANPKIPDEALRVFRLLSGTPPTVPPATGAEREQLLDKLQTGGENGGPLVSITFERRTLVAGATATQVPGTTSTRYDVQREQQVTWVPVPGGTMSFREFTNQYPEIRSSEPQPGSQGDPGIRTANTTPRRTSTTG